MTRVTVLGEQLGQRRRTRPRPGVFFGTGIGSAFLRMVAAKGWRFRHAAGHIPLRGEDACSLRRHGLHRGLCVGLVLTSLQSSTRSGSTVFSDRRTSPGLDMTLRTFVEDQALPIATGITLFDPR